jgi:hypothetical protein
LVEGRACGFVVDFVRVDQLIVLIDAEHAVRTQGFHRERAGHSHFALVLVGPIVEVLELRLSGDGLVDLLLTRDPGGPPGGVERVRDGRPFRVRLARDLPFLPVRLERGVQLFAKRPKGFLPLLPDHVDLGIVRDGLQRDVRYALVDKAVADVAVGRLGAQCSAGELGFLCLPIR